MPLTIVRNDITRMEVDAIVNAANKSLLGGGGVDGVIHRAAGPKLLAECRTLHGCETGEAKITKGYNLPAKYVIHTVGPIYRDGRHGEKELLENCYRNSLALAKENNCETVAFPLISAGVYGYPKQEAFKVAVDIITEFLMENEMNVYMVIFGREVVSISKKLFADIQEFIGDEYVEEHTDPYRRVDNNGMDYYNASLMNRPYPDTEEMEKPYASVGMSQPCASAAPMSPPCPSEAAPAKPKKKSLKDRIFGREEKAASALPPDGVEAMALDLPDERLEEWLRSPDESWQQMLLRCIDKKGMTDPECYKKANIDRKLFSKIRSDAHYKPSKATALAFAIALELPEDEIDDMLTKAGYALSRSDRFDLIVSFFIRNHNYNIFEINDALFAFDQNLLGNVSM